MKIIVPMAGRGSRLRPHSLTVPKPMLPVAGSPIVAQLVNEIARANSLAFRWQPVPLPIAMLAARGTEAVFTGLRLPSEPRLTRYSL
ncbi:MAG: sugar phosphate nucleotidyltransferase, partial [Flavobacteriaceae bacterium]